MSLGQLMTASQKSCSELYECSSQGELFIPQNLSLQIPLPFKFENVMLAMFYCSMRICLYTSLMPSVVSAI